MKKILLAGILCGVMALGIIGCNNSKKIDNNDIHSFEGTIIECEQKSMIVRPNESEEEHKSSDKFRIEYIDGFNSCNVSDKVKITYEGMINESYPAQIGTTKIEVESASDFKLIFNQEPGNVKKQIIDKNTNDQYDYNVYTCNGDVQIVIDNKTYSLLEALNGNKITIDEIIAKANKDLPNTPSYDDGGSKVFKYDDYTIIKFHTIDGNRNVYIGNEELSIYDVKQNDKNKSDINRY